MATIYVVRHRSPGEGRASADAAEYRKSSMLEGLKQTGRVLDGWKPYRRQWHELGGIQRRINRIERGQERP